MARKADQTLGSLPGSEGTQFQKDQNNMLSTLKTHWVLILVILVLVYAAWHYGMKK